MKKKLFTLLTLLIAVCSGAWAVDYGTFIVKFTSTPSQSRTDGKTGDFFTYSGASQSYTGKYDDVELTSSSKGGLKLNSSGWLRFTTLAKSNIIIVQSDDKNPSDGIKINGIGNTSGVPNATDGVVVFTLNNQAAGSYEITRNGSEVGIIYVKVEYTEEPVQTYTASFANGGHGTAPSAQEDVSFVTLPTIGENFYAIAGWKANQDVTVDDATVTAGTLIAVGKDAYLSSNTTFTAQWTTSDYPYVDGVTFPASLPETALDMNTQTIYSATDGYVVLEPRVDVYNGGSTKNFWMTSLNANGSSVKWTAPEGSKFPSGSSETTLSALRTDRTYAFKFTGTTEFEAMLNPRKGGFEAHVLVVDMTDKSIVGNQGATVATESNKVAALTTDHIKTFSNLDATHTYIVYFYSTCDNTNGVIYGIALKIPTSVMGKITPAGWASFSSSYALDLNTISGGTAYYASKAEDNTVTLSTTTATVPANNGLMIKGEADATFTIATAASGTAIEGNLLKASNGSQVAASTDGAYHYVFGYSKADASIYGFYNLASDTEVPAGKAYLETTTALTSGGGARALIIIDDENTTGISATLTNNETMNNEYFDLQGRRVAKPTKGLYIVNGKKVVIK